ncbi:unnamed protein product [Caenorhabditis angaria]|uniref:RRM domain-containing protein n=1 Tax=Caenorhabditis angaria TaxID=860376 RepID=A0A9P1IBK9_9PELO|nr:unnamed protein product [Caenorhabditis angaria]
MAEDGQVETVVSDGEKPVVENENEAKTEPEIAPEIVDYIIVQDPNSDEVIELPTSEGNVLITTLQSSFPGATGLKFKNPKTGANRAVQVDPTGIKLLAPADGWENKTFAVIVAPRDVSSAKRRKVGSSEESDSDDGGGGNGRDASSGRSGRKRALPQDYDNHPSRDTHSSSATNADCGEVQPPVDLIVLGVDFNTSDEKFREYFEKLGSVVFCEIKRKNDGNSKGFGFVRMATVEEQSKVISIPQHMIDGRRCDVKVPEGKDRTGKISRIFVGRLTDKVDENSLRTVFGDEAKRLIETAVVTDVFIPKPFRGFAFVTLSSVEAAEKIVRQGTLVVNGVSVGLSIAQPREESQSMGPDYGLPAGYRNRRDRIRTERRSLPDQYSRNDYPSYASPSNNPSTAYWSPNEQRRWY